jgi:hypothetical protein
MLEKERVEFGLFSTQISREWHMGHAVRAFSRPGGGPRLLKLLMSHGPILLPDRWGERCIDLSSVWPFEEFFVDGLYI